MPTCGSGAWVVSLRHCRFKKPNRQVFAVVVSGAFDSSAERHNFEMLPGRRVICLLGSVPLAAWFAAAQIGLICAVAPGASAATPKVLFEAAARSQTPQTLSVPADSPRWELQGQAKAAEYQG
ncbi:MAG TPA: hypothetical protein VF240_10845, partial [Pyrinomonadaceae bacterium]